MTETINDRIEMLVNERFSGNKAAFAKSIGLSSTGLSNYLSKHRRSKPSVDMVTRIITTHDVDARWLLTGEDAQGNNAIASGDGAVAVNGNGTAHHFTTNASSDAVLAERVKALEALLAEKERLIKVLMENRK